MISNEPKMVGRTHTVRTRSSLRAVTSGTGAVSSGAGAVSS